MDIRVDESFNSTTITQVLKSLLYHPGMEIFFSITLNKESVKYVEIKKSQSLPTK